MYETLSYIPFTRARKKKLVPVSRLHHECVRVVCVSRVCMCSMCYHECVCEYVYHECVCEYVYHECVCEYVYHECVCVVCVSRVCM